MERKKSRNKMKDQLECAVALPDDGESTDDDTICDDDLPQMNHHKVSHVTNDGRGYKISMISEISMSKNDHFVVDLNNTNSNNLKRQNSSDDIYGDGKLSYGYPTKLVINPGNMAISTVGNDHDDEEESLEDMY